MSSPDPSKQLPTDLTGLRRFAMQLKSGEVELPLGKRSLAGLCKMLDDPQLVALHNIRTLATELELSPATLSRMARILGYNSFNEFQQVFKRQVRDPNRYYSEHARQLSEDTDLDISRAVSVLANECHNNISQSIELNDSAALTTAVDWLSRAPRVQVLGYRQSAALSLAMSYGLSMIRGQVQSIGVNGQGLTVALSQLRAGDVLVLICSSPYSRDTVEGARIGSERGARVLAITDSLMSPLIDSADVAVLAPSSSRYFSSSMSAALFLIEALLTITAKRMGNQAIKNLELREDMINRLNDGY